jgi:hypothetical protein
VIAALAQWLPAKVICELPWSSSSPIYLLPVGRSIYYQSPIGLMESPQHAKGGRQKSTEVAASTTSDINHSATTRAIHYKGIKMSKVYLGSAVNTGKVEMLLSFIDPNVEFDTFYEITHLVFIETAGSDTGYAVLKAWAEQRDDQDSLDSLKYFWDSYRNDDERCFGMSRLMHLAKQKKTRRK